MASFFSNPRYASLLLGLPFLSMYLLGYFFPDLFWGTHFAAFLPDPWPWVMLCLGLMCCLVPFYWSGSWPLSSTLVTRSYGTLFIVLLCGLMVSLFYAFPIYLDIYGDSHFIRQEINQTIASWDPRLLSQLFSWDLSSTKFGTDSVYALTNLFTYLLGENGQIALRWVDAVCGGIFALLWLQLLRRELQHQGMRILLGAMGLTAPFLLIFMGHMEVYAPSIMLMMAFLFTLLTFFRTQRMLYCWLLWLLFLLNLKFHITAGLLFPAVFLTSLFVLRNRFPRMESFFTWRKLFLWVLVPILLAGLILYFPLTDSFGGERTYTQDSLTEVLFLPVISVESAPLDRYNLFSLAHFWDYFNLWFLWSAPALFLTTAILVFYRPKINWQQPVLLIVSLTLVLYLLAFFVLNPLLSMPLDWDLFSLPAPLFLVWVLLLTVSVPGTATFRYHWGTILGLVLLGLPVFWINTHSQPLSHRLESLGKRTFQTYWIGASTPILAGMDLETEAPKKLERLLSLVEELQPAAVVGNDLQFAELLCETGKQYFQAGDYVRAQPYFDQAFRYEPALIRNAYFLVVNHFYLDQSQQAHQYLPRLVAYQYPDQQKALAMAVHISLEAEAYEDAANYAVSYLAHWPANPTMQQVRDRLAAGDRIGEIKNLFRRE